MPTGPRRPNFQPSMTLVYTLPSESRIGLSPQKPSPPNMSSPQDLAAAPGSDVTSPGIDERGRGRRRSRNIGRTDDNGDGGTRQSPPGDLSADDPPRKRRRSRKGLDKKFECDHPDCGKSYSRAEHLYRHQLNHNPKDIYYCEFEGCPRYFVRQDLCQRHRERHTARVPPLQRGNVSIPGVTSQASGGPGAKNPLELSPTSGRTDLSSTPGRDSTLTPIKSEVQSPFLPLTRPDISQSTHRGRDFGLAPIKTELAQSTHRPSTEPRPTSASTVQSASTIRSSADALNSLSVFENSPVGPARTGADTGANSGALGLKRSNSDNNFRMDDHGMKNYDGSSATAPRSTPVSNLGENRRQASFGSMDSSRPAFSPQSNTPGYARPPTQQGLMNQAGIYTQPMMSNYASLPAASQPSMGTTPINSGGAMAHPYAGPQGSFVTPQAFVPLSLPPPSFGTMSQANASRTPDGAFVGSPPVNLSSLQTHPGTSGSAIQPCVSDSVLFDAASYTVPVFGEVGYSRSPFHMQEDFVSWLLNEQQAGNPSAIGQMSSLGMTGLVDSQGASLLGYASNDISVDGFFPQTMAQSQHPMAVTSILDSGQGESSLSDGKRQELIKLIEMRFNENDHAKVKTELLEGDRNDDNHVLSLHLMQSYIWSYWSRFHPQLPILHQPTFIPDQQPNLLLIAMIAIGAPCLEKEHGRHATQEGAKLANFLAWHLRGEIFNHAHFRPPAKLWVFQALLLLEIYQKMYSTRPLHEGAHIHHGSTITLMRRGSALIGKSVDTPPSVGDEKSTHGSNSSAHTPSGSASDKWWHEWILGEATRRAAFAAFVIDSLHATMFGHSAVMVAHEMQLPLPYDEALWSATSSAEVGRIESSLNANGIKRPRFLEGLKATLNQQKVRTNSFGRTILMAGLLSVSWHMNQRDLQVSSLGVVQQLGGKDKWRGALRRAFDFWKTDFDASLAENPESSSSGSYQYHGSQKVRRDGIEFESKNVLHHLAHMAMHVDIVDCQIFARSQRLLGRAIGPQDYSGAQRRMTEWATTARARDATYYALRFLSEVLIPTDDYGPQAMHTPPSSEEHPRYSAREDFMMNRPWVLYFAALIVWSYGYAIEGPISPWRRPPSNPVEKQQDMYEFLHRAGSVGSPEVLVNVPGKNQCVGTLMVVRDTFEKTRWELLQEACGLLTNCINMLVGSSG